MFYIENCFNAFFSIILNIVNNAPFVCYLIIASFTTALIFNIIHLFLGGK